MESKTCTVCLQSKTLDQYRKYSGRGRFGLRPLCKICQREYEAGWRSQAKEYRKAARAKRAGKAAEYGREYRAENRAKYLIAECRRRCLKRGITFDLLDHVSAVQARISVGVCEVSGIPLDLRPTEGRRYNTPSIDRKVPSLGYVYPNIRIVALAVNSAMGDWGEEIALEIAKSWVEKASR